ncbi:unnamed protein product [Rotaria sp. Silwood2]|nr:unnamed protein product [Rotaria sp. Silwood2]
MEASNIDLRKIEDSIPTVSATNNDDSRSEKMEGFEINFSTDQENSFNTAAANESEKQALILNEDDIDLEDIQDLIPTIFIVNYEDINSGKMEATEISASADEESNIDRAEINDSEKVAPILEADNIDRETMEAPMDSVLTTNDIKTLSLKDDASKISTSEHNESNIDFCSAENSKSTSNIMEASNIDLKKIEDSITSNSATNYDETKSKRIEDSEVGASTGEKSNLDRVEMNDSVNEALILNTSDISLESAQGSIPSVSAVNDNEIRKEKNEDFEISASTGEESNSDKGKIHNSKSAAPTLEARDINQEIMEALIANVLNSNDDKADSLKDNALKISISEEKESTINVHKIDDSTSTSDTIEARSMDLGRIDDPIVTIPEANFDEIQNEKIEDSGISASAGEENSYNTAEINESEKSVAILDTASFDRKNMEESPENISAAMNSEIESETWNARRLSFQKTKQSKLYSDNICDSEKDTMALEVSDINRQKTHDSIAGESAANHEEIKSEKMTGSKINGSVDQNSNLNTGEINGSKGLVMILEADNFSRENIVDSKASVWTTNYNETKGGKDVCLEMANSTVQESQLYRDDSHETDSSTKFIEAGDINRENTKSLMAIVLALNDESIDSEDIEVLEMDMVTELESKLDCVSIEQSKSETMISEAEIIDLENIGGTTAGIPSTMETDLERRNMAPSNMWNSSEEKIISIVNNMKDARNSSRECSSDEE